MKKLKENGKPLHTRYGQVVSADIIAKLSGVSLSNVGKVMAAQWLLSRDGVITAEHLVDFGALPSALPDETRAENTEAVYDALCEDTRTVPLTVLGRLSRRFREVVQDKIEAVGRG